MIARVHKIACPFCGHGQSKVTNSRPAVQAGVSLRGDGVLRRRECLRCHRRYTTSEILIGKYPPPSSSSYHI